MAELLAPRRFKSTRVETKGRFTITELVPGSPCSPGPAPNFSEDEREPQTPSPPSVSPVHAAEASMGADTGVKEPEAHPKTKLTISTPPASAGSSPSNQQLSPERRPSGSSHYESYATNGSVALQLPSSPWREPVNLNTRKRIKRKGRFTIIELASDSPRSRRDSDCDRAFSTKTSISMTSSEISQLRHDASSHRFSKKDADSHQQQQQRLVRSLTMPRVSHHRSRMRSESPIRAVEAEEPSNNITSSTEMQPEEPVSEAAQTMSSLNDSGISITNMSDSTRVMPQPPVPAAAPSSIQSNFYPNGSVKHSAPKHPFSGRRPFAQKAITISAAQFMQQQQTIASLMRQHFELKQLIGVLQEQQQQLMNIPGQLRELKMERAPEPTETTKDLYMQVDTLMRANKSLQTLLHHAEQDIIDGNEEIECVTEENDELRHRCEILENKYIEERKQWYIMEEELQRFRMMSLNHELEQRLSPSQAE